MKKIFPLFCLSLCLQNTVSPNIMYRNCNNDIPIPKDKAVRIGDILYSKPNEPAFPYRELPDFYNTTICPKSKDIRELSICYYKGETLYSQADFQVQDPPSPNFRFYEGEKEIHNCDTILAVSDVNIQVENKAISRNFDRRYHFGKIQIKLYQALEDTYATDSFSFVPEFDAPMLHFRTSAIPHIERYAKGRIILEEISRKNYNNVYFPIEDMQIVFDFYLKANPAKPINQDSSAIYTPYLTFHQKYPHPDKFIPAQKRPEGLNMDDVKMNIGYPALARESGIEGDVTLKLLIDAEGNTIDYIVLKRVHPILLESDLRYIDNLICTPAIQAGKAIPFWMALPFKICLQ